jgi:sigma-B regulation protein RsbU (phosphoserine phosphatase)
MREMSLQTDPQEMVRLYAQRMRSLLAVDRSISISRRGLEAPHVLITRNSQWKEVVNPWKQRDKLPRISGGLLSELIYGDDAVIDNDFHPDPDDPAYPYLEGMRSIMAIPQYDRGASLNMVILMLEEPDGFAHEDLPERVWMSNLFGRATHNLVLHEQLQDMYTIIDNELEVVADIQRSLLPREVPHVPNIALATYYRTSRRAGGDYYDLFPLSDGRLGILIADVSGHGTPAAVLMAITHSIVHSCEATHDSPGRMLAYMNRRLTSRYTIDSGLFVTAFLGIFDPATRQIVFANAGHPRPRLKRCADGSVLDLNGDTHLPLGLVDDEVYPETTMQLVPGDQIIFYTDGITEAFNEEGEMFEIRRLDRVLDQCALTADGLIQTIVQELCAFTRDAPPADDQTLLVAKIT